MQPSVNEWKIQWENVYHTPNSVYFGEKNGIWQREKILNLLISFPVLLKSLIIGIYLLIV